NKFIKRNPNTCFVALDEQNKIVGAVLCGNDGRRGYIYHLAVDKNYRRRGVGKHLIQNASNALRDLGIMKAALLVLHTNKEGNEFWENIGYYERYDIIYRDKSLDDRNI
ncbi:MAG: GNAT family N-acetyltransferase, partial [Eubacteriaceae bacterium]|nr:GNAT family N-acetyltransferase [Eubacteriaceae bacterium]